MLARLFFYALGDAIKALAAHLRHGAAIFFKRGFPAINICRVSLKVDECLFHALIMAEKK